MAIKGRLAGSKNGTTRVADSGSRGALQTAAPAFNVEEVTNESREAWQDCLSRIQASGIELRKQATKYWDVWYRGQTQQSYSLMPSLMRGYPDPDEEETWDFIWGEEQDLYWEFAARARELHNVVDEDWDILFAMQHYGVPTRLLDWTETLAVSVYFALHRFSANPGEPLVIDKMDAPCIWVMNPFELNTWSMGEGDPRDLYDPKNLGWDDERREFFGYSDLFLEGGMDWDFPVAVYPRQRTTRMQVQRGWFTIHGDKFVALDSLEQQNRFLRKVIIPPEAELGAREFLHNAGIELFTIFPDLQNLAASLGRRTSVARNEFLRDQQDS
jgi:hypothetical protein